MTTTVQHYLDKGLRGLWYPVLASVLRQKSAETTKMMQ